MTDYRDPNYRDPNRPGYDPQVPAGAQPWSNATWGWIAGIAIVVLVLIFAFGSGRDTNQTATDTANPPATTGQRSMPAKPASGPSTDAPTMNRPAPAPATPAPSPSPAPDAR